MQVFKQKVLAVSRNERGRKRWQRETENIKSVSSALKIKIPKDCSFLLHDTRYFEILILKWIDNKWQVDTLRWSCEWETVYFSIKLIMPVRLHMTNWLVHTKFYWKIIFAHINCYPGWN